MVDLFIFLPLSDLKSWFKVSGVSTFYRLLDMAGAGIHPYHQQWPPAPAPPPPAAAAAAAPLVHHPPPPAPSHDEVNSLSLTRFTPFPFVVLFQALDLSHNCPI